MKIEDAIKSNRFVNEQHKASINLLFTAYMVKKGLCEGLKSEEITIEQFNVLRILNGRHPEHMCVKDIGSRMIEKSSNVPRIVDKLVEKKLAIRVTSTEDKRETLISLTDKGIALAVKAKERIDFVTNDIIKLSNEEAKMLNSLLDRLRS